MHTAFNTLKTPDLIIKLINPLIPTRFNIYSTTALPDSSLPSRLQCCQASRLRCDDDGRDRVHVRAHARGLRDDDQDGRGQRMVCRPQFE